MKTIILFSLALCIFAANSAPTPSPVLDSGGKYVRTGAKYYVMPVPSDDELGGLYPVNFTGAVAQYRDYDLRLPLTFTPSNSKKGVIRLSTDVNIKFSDVTGWHIKSNVWKVKYDKALKQYAVMVGGVEGNPGPETLDNWFKIEKTNDNGYKFVFCPSVCSYCKVMCKGVGTVIDKDGWRRLVLSNDPASFVFWSTY